MPFTAFVDEASYRREIRKPKEIDMWQRRIMEVFSNPGRSEAEVRALIREGIPDDVRGWAWCELLRIESISAETRDYGARISQLFGSLSENDNTNVQPPSFGGITNVENLTLSNKGFQACKKILCIIAHDFPIVDYCPLIPSLAAIMCHHMSAYDLLGCMTAVLTASTNSLTEWVYLPLHRKDVKVYKRVFQDLALRYASKPAKHIIKLHKTEKELVLKGERASFSSASSSGYSSPPPSASSLSSSSSSSSATGASSSDTTADTAANGTNSSTKSSGLPSPIASSFSSSGGADVNNSGPSTTGPLSPMPNRGDDADGTDSTLVPYLPWDRWLVEFFVELFPLQVIFRIVDEYLSEGIEALYRFALAALVMNADQIVKANKLSKIDMIFSEAAEGLSATRIEQFFQSAHSFTAVTRAEVSKLATLHRKLEEEVDEPIAHVARGMFFKPAPSLHKSSTCLSKEMWISIWQWIPGRYRIMNLDLIFSSRDHGHSLMTLYNKCGDREPTVLLIRTTEGHVFGAFLSAAWSRRDYKNFFGNGETFIFSIAPESRFYLWDQEATENTLFQFGTKDYLAIGGGGGQFGIWLDSDLYNVSSAPCNTFGNQSVITGTTGMCQCEVVEVFGFC